MFGEFLTKLAIVVTGIVFTTTGINPVVAFLFTGLALVLSVKRDSYLRAHGSFMRLTGQPRMLPTFGALWLISMLILLTLSGFVSLAGGSPFMSSVHVTLTACLVALFVRVICIGIESSVNWGCEKYVDPLIDRFVGSSGSQIIRRSNGLPPEPIYTSFVPPSHWDYRCPCCGARVQHAIDICWNCDYGNSPSPGTIGNAP